ncbi:hypothetical protein B7P43_G13628 [Cryptotermes secundus]|uniref:Uncharacterized protein n=1 Tax=Cryptotermes secundus TaxID=105785 RepID=A0A2J7RPI9_9NEOP|nr:hypothetical protein B7P43_G13628 [Cryptotermes secundus]
MSAKKNMPGSAFNKHMAEKQKCGAENQTKQHNKSNVSAGKRIFPEDIKPPAPTYSWCQHYYPMEKKSNS